MAVMRRGEAGGRAVAARRGSAGMAELGRLGGRATAARHGSEHMSRIGKAGFQTTVNRHWGGDKQAFCRRLVELGLMAQDSFIMVNGERRPVNGAWQREQRPGEPW